MGKSTRGPSAKNPGSDPVVDPVIRKSKKSAAVKAVGGPDLGAQPVAAERYKVKAKSVKKCKVEFLSGATEEFKVDTRIDIGEKSELRVTEASHIEAHKPLIPVVIPMKRKRNIVETPDESSGSESPVVIDRNFQGILQKGISQPLPTPSPQPDEPAVPGDSGAANTKEISLGLVTEAGALDKKTATPSPQPNEPAVPGNSGAANAEGTSLGRVTETGAVETPVEEKKVEFFDTLAEEEKAKADSAARPSAKGEPSRDVSASSEGEGSESTSSPNFPGGFKTVVHEGVPLWHDDWWKLVGLLGDPMAALAPIILPGFSGTGITSSKQLVLALARQQMLHLSKLTSLLLRGGLLLDQPSLEIESLNRELAVSEEQNLTLKKLVEEQRSLMEAKLAASEREKLDLMNLIEEMEAEREREAGEEGKKRSKLEGSLKEAEAQIKSLQAFQGPLLDALKSATEKVTEDFEEMARLRDDLDKARQASEELAKVHAETDRCRTESEELAEALTRAEEERLSAAESFEKERIINLAELSRSEGVCRALERRVEELVENLADLSQSLKLCQEKEWTYFAQLGRVFLVRNRAWFRGYWWGFEMFRALMSMDKYKVNPAELRLDDFEVDKAAMEELIMIGQEELPAARFLESTHLHFEEEVVKEEDEEEEEEEEDISEEDGKP